MKLLTGLAIFLLWVSISLSQNPQKPGVGIIAGNLLDSALQKAVAGADVQLIQLPAGKSSALYRIKTGSSVSPILHLVFTVSVSVPLVLIL